MRHDESEMQAIVVRHIKYRYPNILITCAPGTSSSPIIGARNKRMGYLKGFPDLFIAEPRKGFYGLFIELKTAHGKVQPEQEIIINKLNDLGYRAKICRSAEIAILEVEAYLKNS